ncbi:GumL protein [Neptunitalea chrysea]|uniref:GumL protein n=1 Tax=Neptunitalea chrysea TaxID=1647581 RepID=A0A9W6B3R1_9FLAO|nr:polysaccharide pyruvyl transferase family protein [Neptunitalea chrysea]GLB52038.1 GumL protein [Neptunitalea chrysea]
MKGIYLYWWSEIFIQKKNKENYGDLLGKYLVEKISGNRVHWFNPKKKWFLKKPIVYATIGSILSHVKKDWIVWGSGIIFKTDKVENAKFLAVRGPQSRKHLLALGYSVPEVYGDPGLLLPDFYNPVHIEKKYSLGIIPHYNDYKMVSEMYLGDDDVKIINLMTNDIEGTTDEILSCESIVSSSLHGIIMAHAYKIPAVWVEFSDKVHGDGVKYQDYFESVNMDFYEPLKVLDKLSKEDLEKSLNDLPSKPDDKIISTLKMGLMEVCPFKH